MYSRYLEFSGFDVVEAGNGMEALQRAVDTAPDIILMDLSLPVMDGWEATRRLKADERTAAIPVVALTGHALAGISEGAKKAGLRRVRHEAVPARRSGAAKSARFSTVRRHRPPRKARRSGKYAKTRLAPQEPAGAPTRSRSGQARREAATKRAATGAGEVRSRRVRNGAVRADEPPGAAATARGERRRSEKILHGGRAAPPSSPPAAPAAASTSTASSSRATRCASARSASAPIRPTSTPCTTRTSRRSSPTRRSRCSTRRARTCSRTSA